MNEVLTGKLMIDAIFPPVIDATMRSAFLTCPHYFFRRHCQGLTTGEAVSIDLHFGACFAKGLEIVRRRYCAGAPQGLAICHGGEAILQAWAGYEFNPRTRNQENKSLDNCLLALNDYFRQWSLDTDPVRIHMRDGEPCIEFSGAWPIPGCYHPELIDEDTGEPLQLTYAGRFDMIGDYEASVWGLDDKTGQISTDNTKWALRGQFTGYCWLAREYGLPLRGFLVREVQPLTHNVKFNQVITPRPPWMINRWLEQLRVDVTRMLACWNVHEHCPDQAEISFDQVLDNGCYAYNRPCEMTPLCTAEHPDRWLNTYTIQRWNPLERPTR